MVLEDRRVVMLTENFSYCFTDIFIFCMRQNINVTIIHAISYKVMVGVVSCLCLSKPVVLHKLLYESNSDTVVGVENILYFTAVNKSL